LAARMEENLAASTAACLTGMRAQKRAARKGTTRAARSAGLMAHWRAGEKVQGSVVPKDEPRVERRAAEKAEKMADPTGQPCHRAVASHSAARRAGWWELP